MKSKAKNENEFMCLRFSTTYITVVDGFEPEAERQEEAVAAMQCRCDTCCANEQTNRTAFLFCYYYYMSALET